MYQINHCLACLSTDIELHPAKLARFLSWRITGNDPGDDVPSIGMKCSHCSFVGSVDRFDQQENANLYTGYRGEEYTRIRNICEPEYQNISKFVDPMYRENRQIGIQKLIKQHVDISQIHQVLDYGGDNGSMIPDCFQSAQRYVFDLSGIETLPDIKKYTPDTKKTFDFLICGHLLEHESDPEDLLAKLKKCAHSDSWIYFELPNNPNPYVGRFHEHINFFNIRSLRILLEKNGFEIIDFYEYGFDSMISCHKNNLCVLTKLV